MRNRAYALVVADGFAYITLQAYPDREAAGLEIWDLNEPALPRSVGWLSLSGVAPVDVAVQQGSAYVVARAPESRLMVLDVSDPAGIVEVASFDTLVGREALLYAFADRIVADASRAYLAQSILQTTPASEPSSVELLALDISDPIRPRALGRYDILPGLSITDIAPADDSLLVSVADTTAGGWYGELYALGIGRPTPWPIESVLEAPVTAMSWIGPTRIVAALAGDANRLPRAILIHVSWPPLRVGRGDDLWLESADIVDSASGEGYAYLLSSPRPAGTEAARLHVLDARRGTAPESVASLDLPAIYSQPGVLALVGSDLYMGGRIGLYLVDVSDPSRPTIIDAAPDVPADVLAAGREVVYAAAGGGDVDTVLTTVDATASGEIRILASVVIDRPAVGQRPEARSVSAMAWSADRLIVALEDGTVRLYDVSIATRPTLLHDTRTGSRIRSPTVATGGTGASTMASWSTRSRPMPEVTQPEAVHAMASSR